MNATTEAGINQMRAGELREAQDLFIRALRDKPEDVETWLYLTMTLESGSDRAMCLRYLVEHVDPSNDAAHQGLIFLAPDIGIVDHSTAVDLRPLEFPVAGVHHGNRQAAIRDIRLGQKMLLRREPYNPFDTNAVRVESESGLHIGYVPRQIAPVLAAYADELLQLIPATVTELTAGYRPVHSAALKLTLLLPKRFELPPGTHEYLEYYYDDTGHYHYILLDCSESVLRQVEHELRTMGITVSRSGLSSRPAPDGRLYQWFLRIEYGDSEIDVSMIEALFEDVFGVLSNQSRLKRLEEARQEIETILNQAEQERSLLEMEKDGLVVESLEYLQDAEDLRDKIRQKDSEIESLEYQLARKQDEVDLQRRREKSSKQPLTPTPGQIEQVITYLLPDLEFLRDSLDVLSHETQEMEKALERLLQLSRRPETIRAKDFECAPGFKELYFGRDGRIYFRRIGSGTTQVLISDKQHQREDDRYLRSFA